LGSPNILSPRGVNNIMTRSDLIILIIAVIVLIAIYSLMIWWIIEVGPVSPGIIYTL
jgi:hypothetical protein